MVSNLNVQLKQKTLELQLADLKNQQHEEKLIQEQSQMKLYAEQVSQLLTTEKSLRLQLTADGEKFQQFQVNFVLCYLSNLNIFKDFFHQTMVMTCIKLIFFPLEQWDRSCISHILHVGKLLLTQYTWCVVQITTLAYHSFLVI